MATPRGETWDEDELRDREIPRDFQNAGANAVFRTRGDSMINAGILEGDILFVRKTRNHRFANGRIVVCRLNGTFTVKRLQMTNDAIHLISEKTGERVVIVNEDAESFSLIGVVVGMSRDFTKRA
ncbi:MAG: LexA family protein [Thermoanaerobaculia bacterium]